MATLAYLKCLTAMIKPSGHGDPSAPPPQRCGAPRRTADDRLLGCRADENCAASTAFRSPSQFAPPWDYAVADPAPGRSPVVAPVPPVGAGALPPPRHHPAALTPFSP